MKRLLTEQEYYTEEAGNLEEKFRNLIEPLVDEYVNQDYSTVEMGYVLFNQLDRMLLFAKAYRDLGSKSEKIS